MCRNALAEQIFVDDNLVKVCGCRQILADLVGQFGEDNGQWPQTVMGIDPSRLIIIAPAVMLNAPLHANVPVLRIDKRQKGIGATLLNEIGPIAQAAGNLRGNFQFSFFHLERHSLALHGVRPANPPMPRKTLYGKGFFMIQTLKQQQFPDQHHTAHHSQVPIHPLSAHVQSDLPMPHRLAKRLH